MAKEKKEKNLDTEEIKEENLEEVKEEVKEEKSELDILKEEKNELNDRYLRLLAEYDNFKKRTLREKEAIYVDSALDTISLLLPVIDNLQRALDSFTDKENDFYKGFEMVYKQTQEIFTKMGVSEIKALGEEFDPELHNAVMHIEDENVTENTIVEEFQKGYMYKEKVIRYSMVKVAN
ncbi:MAG: nucleotide exchange factor GrpE [Ruminococcaceae bacterium]|nr:nucleotide exchange factor GrpE [Oscillospiraceae bacterium]